MDFLTKGIEKLKKEGLYRESTIIESQQGSRIRIGGKELINFASNDYLGLSQHPRVIEASQRAIERFGTGIGSSRLLSGSLSLHTALEEKLAQFKGTEAALVFSSGYAANLGIISSMAHKDNLIIIDKLNHASIIDGCRLSQATWRVYPHNDMTALERILSKSSSYGQRFIITETIFSMDGDIANLQEIVRLSKKYNALLMVDEAHSTGVLGKEGKGAIEYLGLERQVDIQMGTLSKALASLGGFVAGTRSLIEYLRNKARSFIYSTSLPPSVIAAALAALEVLEKEPILRERLLKNSAYLRAKLNQRGWETMSSQFQIIPVLIGDSNQTMAIAQSLYQQGLFIPGIRPPSVPRGKARLRINLTANHSQEDVDRIISVFEGLT